MNYSIVYQQYVQRPVYTLWGIKKHTEMCFAITFVKLDWFWTNLADCFLNKFFIKQCKQMSPEPSTSFVLSAQTWKSPTANPPSVQPLSHGFSRCIKTRAFGYVVRRAWSQGHWCILPRCPLEAADVARYSAYVRGRLHIPAGQRTCTPCTGHYRAATTWNPRFHWTRCLASEFTRPQSSWL